jgi:hypothetical protein
MASVLAGSEVGGDCRSGVGVEFGDDHVGAGGVKGSSVGFADSAAGSGNDGGFSREGHGATP